VSAAATQSKFESTFESTRSVSMPHVQRREAFGGGQEVPGRDGDGARTTATRNSKRTNLDSPTEDPLKSYSRSRKYTRNMNTRNTTTMHTPKLNKLIEFILYHRLKQWPSLCTRNNYLLFFNIIDYVRSLQLVYWHESTHHQGKLL
jgi:hypothetical protein